MNEAAIDLDENDEYILTRDVSDEALEAAAGYCKGSGEGSFWTCSMAAPCGIEAASKLKTS